MCSGWSLDQKRIGNCDQKTKTVGRNPKPPSGNYLPIFTELCIFAKIIQLKI